MLKRLFDFLLAAILCVILLPIILLAWAAVRVFLGSPAIFKQERAGLNGRIFYLYKFRSMTSQKDQHGNLLPDEQRLTRFGQFLRKTSLDELPQLLNVLKGDISFIGPRPLLVQYLPLYTKQQKRRHEVKPGITGWAQVNGRNAISWEEKFKLDVWYVDHRSLHLDIKIFFLTFLKTIRPEGINTSEGQSMPVFTGVSEDRTGDLKQ